MWIESILLITVRVQPFMGNKPLTNATGFFERGELLSLIAYRHVILDTLNAH